MAAPTYTRPPAVAATSVAVVASRPKAAATPVRRPLHRTQKTVAHPDVKVIDVAPLRVDIHRGLGAVTRSLRDDSLLLLAGIALLVATLTAASGTTLALIASRSSRTRG